MGYFSGILVINTLYILIHGATSNISNDVYFTSTAKPVQCHEIKRIDARSTVDCARFFKGHIYLCRICEWQMKISTCNVIYALYMMSTHHSLQLMHPIAQLPAYLKSTAILVRYWLINIIISNQSFTLGWGFSDTVPFKTTIDSTQIERCPNLIFNLGLSKLDASYAQMDGSSSCLSLVVAWENPVAQMTLTFKVVQLYSQ